MPSQAELIRLHREAKGLSLEQVAFGIEQLAKVRHIPETSKAVPRTHASLSRWETEKVQIKALGLELIAEAMGLTVEDLRREPPKPNQRPTRMVEVPADQVEMVDAFLKATAAR